jgi:hypothetical protein
MKIAPQAEMPEGVGADQRHATRGLKLSRSQHCVAFSLGDPANRPGVTGDLRIARGQGEQPESVLDLATKKGPVR